MPGYVVHQNATVKCPHGGTAVLVPASRVKVSGMSVALASVYTVTGCGGPSPPGPCVSGKWLTFSTRVFADGQPIVLLDSQSLSASSGVPLVIVQTQTRVKAT